MTRREALDRKPSAQSLTLRSLLRPLCCIPRGHSACRAGSEHQESQRISSRVSKGLQLDKAVPSTAFNAQIGS